MQPKVIKNSKGELFHISEATDGRIVVEPLKDFLSVDKVVLHSYTVGAARNEGILVPGMVILVPVTVASYDEEEMEIGGRVGSPNGDTWVDINVNTMTRIFLPIEQNRFLVVPEEDS